MEEKAVISWSGGKDSALALYKTLLQQQYKVMTLLTTINAVEQRISMHGVRVELLEKQVESIGLQLVKIELPEMPAMEEYDRAMSAIWQSFKQKGAKAAIFGDIFLEDLRTYRENKLSEIGLKGVFPLWKIPTKDLMYEFLEMGFMSVVTCVNEEFLDRSLAGRIIDAAFLDDLPFGVDPCGENGEFHTFVFDGPIFKTPVPFKKGNITYRKFFPKKKDDIGGSNTGSNNGNDPFKYGFWYCDLL